MQKMTYTLERHRWSRDLILIGSFVLSAIGGVLATDAYWKIRTDIDTLNTCRCMMQAHEEWANEVQEALGGVTPDSSAESDRAAFTQFMMSTRAHVNAPRECWMKMDE